MEIGCFSGFRSFLNFENREWATLNCSTTNRVSSDEQLQWGDLILIANWGTSSRSRKFKVKSAKNVTLM